MSVLSRHVFHPLWDVKDGSRSIAGAAGAREITVAPRRKCCADGSRERLAQVLRYAQAHSPLLRAHV